MWVSGGQLHSLLYHQHNSMWVFVLDMADEAHVVELCVHRWMTLCVCVYMSVYDKPEVYL